MPSEIIQQRCNELTAALEEFEREANTIYSNLVIPHWNGELHGFPRTLYSYMMLCFALIDLYSAYWKGNSSTEGQSQRMIEFMQKYLLPDQEACSIAVQMWRHKLMHTGEPQYLLNKDTGKVYRWLLHWGEHLPAKQHFKFSETSDSRILKLGLLYLIRDLKMAFKNYLGDLSLDTRLQSNFEKVEEEIRSSEFRTYKRLQSFR